MKHENENLSENQSEDMTEECESGKRSLDIVSDHAALLSFLEVGLGSIVHGLRVPMGGQLMSLNQGAILTLACQKIKASVISSVIMISSIAAIMKSLSPAGNKLGPMLSISMQGFLYSFGLLLFGVRLPGVILGMVLLSFWSFVQPLVTYYLFFGSNLVEAFEFYLGKMEKTFGFQPQNVFWTLAGLIALKAVIAAVIGFYAVRFPQKTGVRIDALMKRAPKIGPSPKTSNDSDVPISLLALRDLTRPFFVVSFLLMIVFFAFTRSEWSQIIWLSLRPLAIAFVFFYISRSPLFFSWIRGLRKYSLGQSFFAAFDASYAKLSEMQYGTTETAKEAK